MNGLTRVGFAVALVSVASLGYSAESRDTGFGLKVGYYTGQSFSGVADQRIRLQGPQFGVDVPLTKLGERVQLRFSPSAMFGGSLATGSDNDGNLYRMMLAAEIRDARAPSYWIVGAGFGFAHDRGATRIRHKSGFVAQVGYGMSLGGRFRGGLPYAEISVFAGSSAFQGLGVDFGLRF